MQLHQDFVSCEKGEIGVCMGEGGGTGGGKMRLQLKCLRHVRPSSVTRVLSSLNLLLTVVTCLNTEIFFTSLRFSL